MISPEPPRDDVAPRSKRRGAASVLVGAGALATFACAIAIATGASDAEAASSRGRRRHREHRDAGGAVADAGASDAQEAAAHDPGCLYGRVVDGHSGEVRCLSPVEVDPADAGTEIDAEVRAAREDAGAVDAANASVADAGAPPARRGVIAELASLALDGGDVPRAQSTLARLVKADVARCVAEHGGVTSEVRAHARFLVRARGRVEGLEIESKPVAPEVARCLTSTLSGRAVGAPSTEPIAADAVVVISPNNERETQRNETTKRRVPRRR